jgi:ATP-dependent exoDNAse (exonuclease V) alpha subunit
LIIASAISIHKCQGVSLDSGIVDLKNVFCNHQVYVAISRIRSLDGLKLLNFNEKKNKNK